MWVSYEPSDSRIKKIASPLIDRLPDGIKPDVLDDWAQRDFK